MDDGWPAVMGYLRKAWKKWDWLSQILVREGDNPCVSEMFFKAFFQEVLLFGSESLVMTPA